MNWLALNGVYFTLETEEINEKIIEDCEQTEMKLDTATCIKMEVSHDKNDETIKELREKAALQEQEIWDLRDQL